MLPCLCCNYKQFGVFVKRKRYRFIHLWPTLAISPRDLRKFIYILPIFCYTASEGARRHILLGMPVAPELTDTSYYRELLQAHRREIVALVKNPEREVLTPRIKAHALLLCVSPGLARLWHKRRAINR